jgi:hypothetical protein
MGVERTAAQRIRRLVLHGLRRRVDWFWRARWVVRVRAEARRQRAAGRIIVAWRAFVAYRDWRRARAQRLIAAFWRKLRRIDGVRRRVLACLAAVRVARTKQLAVALLRRALDASALRRCFEKMRLIALLERWHDERRYKRLRGLVPVYGPDGKRKVQVRANEKIRAERAAAGRR